MITAKATLTGSQLDNGSINYVPKVPGRPRTEDIQVDGNVTINNITEETEEKAAYFEANFMVTGDFLIEDARAFNVFNLKVVVPETDDNAAYREVEDRAAHLVPVMLRLLADDLDKHLVEADKSREKNNV